MQQNEAGQLHAELAGELGLLTRSSYDQQMSQDELLESVRSKACGIEGLPMPASEEDLRDAEARLGFPLHPLHVRVLLEVADGGLVRSMYGISSGGERDEGRGVVEMRECLAGPDGRGLPECTVPFVDLGCGTWLLVETRTGRVLGVDEFGIVETEHTLETWLRDWANGCDVIKEAFDHDRAVRRSGINPFTKRPMEVVGRGPLKGRRLSSWPEESG